MLFGYAQHHNFIKCRVSLQHSYSRSIWTTLVGIFRLLENWHGSSSTGTEEDISLVSEQLGFETPLRKSHKISHLSARTVQVDSTIQNVSKLLVIGGGIFHTIHKLERSKQEQND